MRLLRSAGVLVVIAALGFILLPKIGASDWDQKSMLTFTQAVEVPGTVLPAGTYVFKVLDARNVIRILNKDESHVLATFTSIPKYTERPYDRTFIQYAERPMGSPPAIGAWFYPGRIEGHEFIYPMQGVSEFERGEAQILGD